MIPYRASFCTYDIDMRNRQDFTVDYEAFSGLEEYIRETKLDGMRWVIILVRKQKNFRSSDAGALNVLYLVGSSYPRRLS